MQKGKKGRAIALMTFAVGAVGFAPVASKAAPIAQWTFEGDSVATNNTPTPDVGTGTSDAIGMTNSYNSTTAVNTDDVLVGKSGDTGVNAFADTSHEWRVRGQSPGNGWSSQAPIGTQGAQFFASTAGLTSGAVTIGFDFYVTNQAEAEMQVEYTTDGTHYTNIPINIPAGDNAGGGTLTPATNNGSDPNTVTGSYAVAAGGQDWFPGLTATITDPAALDDPNFGFEIVNASTGADVLGASGGAYNNNSGNWRFDNVSIAVAPVPEPATLGLLGIAGLGLMNRRRSRAK